MNMRRKEILPQRRSSLTNMIITLSSALCHNPHGPLSRRPAGFHIAWIVSVLHPLNQHSCMTTMILSCLPTSSVLQPATQSHALRPPPSVPRMVDTRRYHMAPLLHSPMKHLFFEFPSFLWCSPYVVHPSTLEESTLLSSVSGLQGRINCHTRTVK